MVPASGILEKQSFLHKIIAFCIVFGICLVFGAICGQLLLKMGGIETRDLISHLQSKPSDISLVMWMQFVAAMLSFVLPAFILAHIFSPKPLHFLGLTGNSRALILLPLVFLLFMSFYPIVGFLHQFNQALELPAFLTGLEEHFKTAQQKSEQLQKIFLNMEGIGDLLLNLLVVGLLAGAGEELLFRGIIQKTIIQKTGKPILGIISAALLFSCIHFQFYNFLAIALLGFMLGFIYYYSGNLWLSIILHVANNSIIVLSSYFQETPINSNMEQIPIQFVIGGVVVFSVLAGIFLFLSKKLNLYQSYGKELG